METKVRRDYQRDQHRHEDFNNVGASTTSRIESRPRLEVVTF